MFHVFIQQTFSDHILHTRHCKVIGHRGKHMVPSCYTGGFDEGKSCCVFKNLYSTPRDSGLEALAVGPEQVD